MQLRSPPCSLSGRVCGWTLAAGAVSRMGLWAWTYGRLREWTSFTTSRRSRGLSTLIPVLSFSRATSWSISSPGSSWTRRGARASWVKSGACSSPVGRFSSPVPTGLALGYVHDPLQSDQRSNAAVFRPALWVVPRLRDALHVHA